MNGDKTNDEIDDSDIFRKEMDGVSPLKKPNRVAHRKTPPPVRVEPQQMEAVAIDDIFSDTPIYEDCPDTLSFSRSGLQRATIKRLRQGKLPVEHVLDLHGLTVQQARAELIDFLNDCELMALRHVIIIHGKGYRSKEKPVIKPMINRWLRVAPTVLAFHSAQPEDGGSGAVYVLLKKNR